MKTITQTVDTEFGPNKDFLIPYDREIIHKIETLAMVEGKNYRFQDGNQTWYENGKSRSARLEKWQISISFGGNGRKKYEATAAMEKVHNFKKVGALDIRAKFESIETQGKLPPHVNTVRFQSGEQSIGYTTHSRNLQEFLAEINTALDVAIIKAEKERDRETFFQKLSKLIIKERDPFLRDV